MRPDIGSTRRRRGGVRTLALGVAVALVATGFGAETGAAPAATGAARQPAEVVDIETATVAELDAVLDAGEISAVDLAGLYIQRIEQTNSTGPGINAVRAINPAWRDEARRADRERRQGVDRGPLMGIPVLVKDNIDVEGMPTSAGSLALADNYPVADAPVVTALKDAGAVILGKTNLTEFAHYLGSIQGGYSSLGGQVLNPYDVSQGPGSSSAGSGAAVAAAMAPLAVGTETCCSIIAPATATSAVGVKTTLGLVSRTGIVPISMNMDVAGPMATTVHDAAAQLSAMTTGADPDDPWTDGADEYVDVDYTEALSEEALGGARVGVVTNVAPTGEPGALWQSALDVIEAQGATLVPIELASARPTTWPYDFHRDLDTYLSTRTADGYPMQDISDVADYYRANPETTLKFGASSLFGAEAVDLEAEREQYELARAADLAASKDVVDAAMAANDLDAIVFPGSASSVSQLGATAGYPTVGVPAGYQPSNRRPFGIAFMGQAFTEADLLGYAYDYEQATLLRRPASEINPSLFRCVGLDRREAAAASCAP